jgi:membrane peptidoglycan carboxypeptidase
MNRVMPVLGALVLVVAVVAVVVWQRTDTVAAPLPPSGDVVLQYSDGSPLWRTGDQETPLIRQVVQELGAKASMTLEQLHQVGGAIVVTTIDPRAQSGAVAVIREKAAAQPASLRYSITAVDPNNGSVRAYAASDDPAADYAGGVLKEPGPLFFPFGVAAALRAGKTLDSTYDGRSPRTFAQVAVSDRANCGERCTVRDALLKSSNVAMYDLVANDVGIKPVVTAARQAGVPESVDIGGNKTGLLVGEGGGLPNAAVSIGASEARMRPLDLASAYATFAAEGTHHDAHFITHVTDVKGSTLYRVVPAATPAFDPDPARSKDIANQITAALRTDGTCAVNPPEGACRHGEWRPGVPDQDQVSHAWMVGYDPRLSVSVFVGSAQAGAPAVDSAGNAVVGSGLPNEMWRAMLEKLTKW